MTMAVQRFDAPLGAHVLGVDLSTPVDDASFATIRRW